MSLETPASQALAVTPGADHLQWQGQDATTRAIVIGGAGSITVTLSGQSIAFTVIAGQTLSVRATHVTAATATGIVALF